MTLFYIISLISTFVITAVILRFLIPYLKSKKMGQKILDIGPRWHKSKEGTPTMGGLSFLIAISLVCATHFTVLYAQTNDKALLFPVICLIFAVLNSVIGMIDDRTKFAKNKNEGLLSWQKYLLQLIVAVLFIVAASRFDFINTYMYLPFFDKAVDLGFFYYVIAVILITGVVNSVNLADGIDGLATTETAVVAALDRKSVV